MTKAELAVERDWLLEHGRTVEEVRDMQHVQVFRVALRDALALLAHADFSNGNSLDGYGPDEGDVLAGRMIARLRLLVSEHKSAAGASTPVQQKGRR